MHPHYPEIDALQNFVVAQGISVSRLEEALHKNLVAVAFQIRDEAFTIQVMDEFHDLGKSNPLLPVVLCLRELELIEESEDFEKWCRFQGIEGNEELKKYYAVLVSKLPALRNIFPEGEIDSFIGDLDFQLNSGAAQALRG